MNSKKKQIYLERDGLKTVWRNGKEKGSVECDVFQGSKLILEWVYPKVMGNAIAANAFFFLEQVILQATAEMENKKS